MDSFVQIESTILEILEFKFEIYDEKFGQNSAIFSTNIAIIEEI